MAFEFLKAIKLNKAVNDAMPIAEICNIDILESIDLLEDFQKKDISIDLLEDFDKDEILSYWERFKDMEWIREYYQAVNDFGEILVGAFIDMWSVDDVQYIGDAFMQFADSEAQFAEELVNDCYCHSEQPDWVVIDWQATWDSALRFDYDFDQETQSVWRTCW